MSESLYDIERRRRWGSAKKVVTKYCRHGKRLVFGGEPDEYCALCQGDRGESFFVPDMTERFNHGLGCMTSGTRDAEKKAKAKGLIPLGDAKPREVFKELWPNHPMAKGY